MVLRNHEAEDCETLAGESVTLLRLPGHQTFLRTAMMNKNLLVLFPALAALLPVSCVLSAASGCAALGENSASKQLEMFSEHVIYPLVEKAQAENSADAYQMTVSAHATNPKYIVEFRGVMGTCIEGTASVGIDGIAGQGQFATQGTPKPAVANPFPQIPSGNQ